MSKATRYYWDSSVFCSYFAKEPGRCDIVSDLLKDAHAGRSEIITSSITLIEVIKMGGGAKPITEKQEKQLVEFFQYPFIKIINADRTLCESARAHVWRHGMKFKDAVHMATALSAAKITASLGGVDALFSWDADFTKLDGDTVIAAPFPIRNPYVKAPELKFDDAAASTLSEESESHEESKSENE